jgi:hypothetical protein
MIVGDLVIAEVVPFIGERSSTAAKITMIPPT